MTFAEFRTAVLYRTETSGKPVIATHPTPGAGLNTHLSDSLKQFCAWTYCLRGSVSGTLTGGASTLAVGSLAPRMVHPLQAAVEGTILTNYAGKRGPCRIEDLMGQAAGTGTPTKWAWQTEEIVKFNKAPASSQTVTFYGFIEHPTVSADGDAITLPSEWQEAAADFAAVRLIQPTAAGSGLEQLEKLNIGIQRDCMRLCRLIQDEFPSVSIPYLAATVGGEQ